MAKMKIYEIARSMQEKLPDIKSKDLVKFLQENGFEAKSAQSTIEDNAIAFLLKNFNQLAVRQESKPVKEDKPAKADKQNSSKKSKPAKEPAGKPAKPQEAVKEETLKEEPEVEKPVTESSAKQTPVSQQKEKIHKKEETKLETATDADGGNYKDTKNNNETNKKENDSKETNSKETKETADEVKQESVNGKRDNMNQNGQNNKGNNYNNRSNNNNNNSNNSNRNNNSRNNNNNGKDKDSRSNNNNRDNRRRDNNNRNDNRDSRGGRDNNNRRDNRDNNNRNDNRGGGRDNRGKDGYNNSQQRDGRRDNNNRRDNRGGRDNRGSAAAPMDSMKSEVKQSRQQRANKDSRSAKQKYGKNRDRDDMENEVFMQQKNHKKKDPDRRGAFIKPEPVAKPAEPEDGIRTITLPEKMTIKELSDTMKVQASTVIKKLFLRGQAVTLNHEITFEEAEEIALEYNCIAEQEEKIDLIAEILKEDEEDEALMKQRPPVVCVMGHVDHGKTSLLDAIRETHVTSREAGGITQHIGAYVTETGGNKITFLDTPGHEAFTSMRMRGAQSTDIAILVVAADDGVMPQTVEAINHAKAAGVEIIVAVNKIDKPSANVERVKQELVEHGLVAEDWGGDTIFVPVSAHTKEGIENLLEMIILTAEVLELKANPNRKARGVVIEAQLDKGRGPVATVLVQKGTLHVGDNIAVGSAYGKIRAMMDDKGQRVKEAKPSTPVEILGLHDVPDAGEIFMATENDKEARNIAETYIEQGREKLLDDTKAKLTLDGLFSQIQAGNIKELNLIVKADVQGSVEAVKQSLLKLSNEEVAVRIIHGAVGAINESDVSLASASNAIIIGFNVRPDNTAKEISEREKVDVRLYKVIYNAIEDIEAAMKGMLDPEYEEKVIGHLEVRQTFKASGIGIIAGSYVLDGKIVRGCKTRVTRDGELLFDGELASLKRFKDDVKEVATGYECGLVFEGFNDIKVEDRVEAYTMVEVPRT
ncbi:MAG: translation initiation factor IF-2 [Lachnospiraceae bacterium]|nr:translation initiation factor IF-2 [Lachnospiraceae bacterium]